MVYIDLSDQMKAFSHSLRRRTKWYRKPALELILGSALVNSLLVYKEATQQKIKITGYKDILARALLGQDKPNDSDDSKQNLVHTYKVRKLIVLFVMRK